MSCVAITKRTLPVSMHTHFGLDPDKQKRPPKWPLCLCRLCEDLDYRGAVAGTQFGFALPMVLAVVVVVPGVLLVVVPGVVVVLVLGVAVVPVLGVAVEPVPIELLLPVVPLTVPVAVLVPVAGTPLEVVEAVVPTGHGFTVVAPPATEPVVPMAPGFVLVAEPEPLLMEPEV